MHAGLTLPPDSTPLNMVETNNRLTTLYWPLAGKVDVLAFEYVASISKWCFTGGGGLGY